MGNHFYGDFGGGVFLLLLLFVEFFGVGVFLVLCGGVFLFFFNYSYCFLLLLLIICCQKRKHVERRMKRNEWVDNYTPSDVLEINHDAVYSGCFPEFSVSMKCSGGNLSNDPAFYTLIFNSVVISANRTQVKTKMVSFIWELTNAHRNFCRNKVKKIKGMVARRGKVIRKRKSKYFRFY